MNEKDSKQTTRYMSGPWFIEKDENGWPRIIEDEEENHIAIISSHLVLRNCLQATANLIAAAPDLLEACKDLLERTPTRYGKAARRWAIIAIAKAEGRA